MQDHLSHKDAIKAEAALLLAEQGMVRAAHYLAQTLFRHLDDSGKPFFGHLARVAQKAPQEIDSSFMTRLRKIAHMQGFLPDVASNSHNNQLIRQGLKTIGYLHDLLEDMKGDPAKGIIGWTARDLREIGFHPFIIDGVLAMTKRGDPYFDEIVRVGGTLQAIPPKRRDLEDNSRLDRMPLDHMDRILKYGLSYHYLRAVQGNAIAPGTPFVDWMRRQPPERQNWEMLQKHSRPEGHDPGNLITIMEPRLPRAS